MIKIPPEQIIEASQITNSATQAAKLLGIKFDTYKKYATELGCYKTNQSGKGISKNRKHSPEHTLNDRYFNIIDTKNKAYLLGFIAADGTITDGKVTINIARKDREVLEYFCHEICYDESHIKDYQSSYTDINGQKHLFDASSLCIYSTQMIADLSKYNVIPNKSHIDNNLLPLLDAELKNAWLVGYIDGDGNIRTEGYTISLVSNYKTVKSIEEYLARKFEVSPNFRKKGEITYEINYHKKQDTIKLCTLYCFASPFQLSRKLVTAKDMISRYLNSDYTGQLHHSSHKQQDNVSRKYYCIDCGKVISYNATRCKSCAGVIKEQQNSKRPEKAILKSLIRTHNFLYIGKLYGVSDNAVRKWCKFYELPYKSTEIKAMSDEDWAKL